MESLVRKRGRVKAKITRIENYISDLGKEGLRDLNINDLSIRETLLVKAFDEYNSIQEQIEEMDEAQDVDRVDVEQKYINIHSKIKTLIQDETTVASTASAASGVAEGNSGNIQRNVTASFRKVNCLNLNIPTFTGNYADWQSFSDIFSALIDKDASLSNSEKLMYLKTVLKGEPLSLINELKITDDNYKVASELLKDRYDKNWDIINSHITALLELQINKGNPKSLREFIAKVKQHIKALQNLNTSVNQWDLILINVFTNKLDFYTRNAFELSRDEKTLPTLNDFLKFLEKRCSSFESAKGKEQTKNLQESKQKVFHSNAQSYATTSGGESSKVMECVFCKSNSHKIYKCVKFTSLSLKEKREFISKNKLCYNCLGRNHVVTQCQSTKCRQCGGKHHSLLHDWQKDNQDKYNAQSKNDTSSSLNDKDMTTGTGMEQTTLLAHGSSYQILLATARVPILTFEGKTIQVRALLDSASQKSFITAKLCKKLNLNVYKQIHKITGIANNETQIELATNITIGSNSNKNFEIATSCLVLEQITHKLPHVKINQNDLNIPDYIQMADPQFHSPTEIDLLLSADIYFDILKPGLVKLGNNLPVLQNTSFGWVIAGAVPNTNFVSHMSVTLFSQLNDIEQLIPRFWQLEELSTNRELMPEDKLCEQIFVDTTKRLKDGTFQVNIPLRAENEHLRLGESFNSAAQRFFSLEKRFLRNEGLYSQYKQFIDEYISLGHGKYVDFKDSKDKVRQRCFLPHHCIIRETSTTTRLRVVFDASMKTTTGVSLNDVMLKGFPVQPELFNILCRFRMYRYGITVDIKKMYRMIQINPNQRFLQNILWRNKPDDDLKCIELQTVTYGTKAAPYLATRCLKQLADEEFINYPLASHAIQHQCYVDDVLGGSDCEMELKQLKEQLIQMLGLGGFILHKWCSNNKTLDTGDHWETKIEDEKMSNKVLGLSWNSGVDAFNIVVPSLDHSQVYTKRLVLSSIAQMFDPLGLIGPVIVIGKILMQDIWVRKLDWDEILPPDISKRWSQFIKDVPNLNSLSIPRWSLLDNPIRMEIHGFADASLKAYGACIFIRGIYANNVSCRLLCSKSRIAPLKTVSLPRLELCGALLLARLMHKVKSILFQRITNIVLWTDSKIVLAWLNSSPSRWTTFVANRVSEIHELTTNCIWHHTSSGENPADYLSRGVNPSDIMLKRQWWEGPKFLYNHDLKFEKGFSKSPILTNIPEERKVVHINTVNAPIILWERFSNFLRLQRSIAYCLRFITNARKVSKRISGPLSVSELQVALMKIIKCIQTEYFHKEIHELNTNKPLTNSTVVTLNPFIDGNGILRVNGRLSKADISYNQKFPILLPSKNHIVRLLIRSEHFRLFHAGAQSVLTNLRLNYWIVHGLREVKAVLKNCVTCHRFKAETAQQLMGSLPLERVSISRPFQKVGVDFGGPILVRQNQLRKSATTKGYFALFVCMACKAIHLELVSSLSTEAFVAALKRFIARRGHPTIIYSDNATNFHGANNQLHDLYKFFKRNENKKSIHDFLSMKQVKWKFIPPNSPHWGGLWEAGIKSTKNHLRRVIGNNSLTFEQLTTVLTQIESILNSRPLCALSTDPSDMACLTPAHFLIGEPLTALPEKDVTNISESRLSFWEKMSKIKQHFWQRWVVEYLNQLQNRPKWYKTCQNLKEGMIVLVKEDNMQPLKWPIARIVEIISGHDGKVRVVKIRTQNGVFTRPITKLSPLPLDLVENQFSTRGEDVEV